MNREWIGTNGKGLLLCLLIALPAWLLGKAFPIVGGAVIAILAGMVVSLLAHDLSPFGAGIKWVSKKILQAAVVLLGFGMNLGVVLETGLQSLPIILVTISVALIIAWAMQKLLHIPSKISVLVGVGSSICGGSAIAATASVIDADDDEIAQAISVIFLFNVIAAVAFPLLGRLIGFDTTGGTAFGIFAGTAINDTSSVTAAAATWDSMWGLGSATLDKAVTVKLTRTLAIIPITLALAFWRLRGNGDAAAHKVSLGKVFPYFILWFVAASVVTTLTVQIGGSAALFAPLKELSKFFIVMAMAAIGLNTDVVKLVKTGGKPIVMGLCCWAGITAASLIMQRIMGLW